MYNHAPDGYVCPICLGVKKIESSQTMLKVQDIVYEDDIAMVFVNSKFVKSNPGHLIVVPKEHLENIYEMPNEILFRMSDLGKQFAVVLKEVRKCDGVTVMQNNEPASNQHAFHYHMHLYPRFKDDEWTAYVYNTDMSTPEQRKPYVDALKVFLENNPIK